MLALSLSVVAAGGAARKSTPDFPAPDCPLQLRAGATLTSSLLSDATHTMKRYEGGGDTHGAEVACNYYDSTVNNNFGWTVYYLFKTDTPAEVSAEVAGGYAPLGGWAHPDLAEYCGVSTTTYSYVECSPSTDADTKAGAIAMLAAAQSIAAPQQSAPTTTTPASTPKATVGQIKGEVEMSTDGGKTFTPASVGAVLKNGDFIATGLHSTVKLNFGYATLTVYSITQLRIDEFTDASHIAKTQLFLRVGSIEARVSHTNAVRSDFSVVTPTCNASIRGSGMVVSESKAGVTTIYTTSDVSYVKGLADKTTLTLPDRYMTTVGASKKASKPVKYKAAGLKQLTA